MSKSGPPARVSLAYAEWGPGARQQSLQEVLRCLRLARCELVQLVIVDNKRECLEFTADSGFKADVVAGSNTSREFSAWDEALNLLSTRPATDVYVFCNDTFATHRRPRQARRRRIAAWIGNVSGVDEARAFGQLDPVSSGVVRSPFGLLDRYFCTYLFGLNRAALSRINPLNQLELLVEEALESNQNAPSVFSASVSPDYSGTLERWLHEPGQWFKAAPLMPTNFSFFRLKAKSILYEHGLSCLLRRRGVRMFDFFDGCGVFDVIDGKCSKQWIRLTRWLRDVGLLLRANNSQSGHSVDHS